MAGGGRGASSSRSSANSDTEAPPYDPENNVGRPGWKYQDHYGRKDGGLIPFDPFAPPTGPTISGPQWEDGGIQYLPHPDRPDNITDRQWDRLVTDWERENKRRRDVWIKRHSR